jgi:hypothetical protein
MTVASFLTGSILSLVLPLGLLSIVFFGWWLSLRRRRG